MRLIGTLIVLSLLIPSLALGFECVARVKDANQAIAAAEKMSSKPAIADEVKAKLDEARKLVVEAEKDHADGAKQKSARLHAASARKAKIAKALAEEAAELAKRM